MVYIPLLNRSIIRLYGPDAEKLLNNITTVNVTKLSEENSLYALILSSKGRYLCDFFLFKMGEYVFIECETADKDFLIGKLKSYRLQLKVKIVDVSEDYSSLVFIPSKTKIKTKKEADLNYCGKTEIENKHIVFRDPRHMSLGLRFIIPSKLNSMMFSEYGKYDDYETIRVLNMVPDCVKDMVRDVSFPLHYGIDKINGIDFNKGCYPGQEVVARMYRSDIKKKLYLVESNEGFFPIIGSKITADGQEVGMLCSSADGLALALLLIEKVSEGRELFVQDVRLKVYM